MPPQAASHEEQPSAKLPRPLAKQAALMRRHLGPSLGYVTPDLVEHIDAGLMAICDLSEVSLDLLNHVLALRATCERLGRAVGEARGKLDPELEAAHVRALSELEALEEVLAEAAPSAAACARGEGW